LTDGAGAAVSAREFEVRYARGATSALSGVDIDVMPGSVLLVTGGPGSGKTSLLHGLLGLAPIAGGVSVLGRPPGDPEALRRIGLAPQGKPFDPRLTGRESAALVAALRGAPSADVETSLNAVGLANADTATGRLDPDETRRLALALGYIGSPDLVLIDDPWEMPETLALVIALRERGAAVILTSEAPGSLAESADATLHLVDGRPS
jgi:ABC-2 type transport system ATP-binding protein